MNNKSAATPRGSLARRMMDRREFLRVTGTGLTGAALLGAAACGSGGSSGKVTMKINNDVAADTLKGDSWRHFKEILTSKLGDKVEVQIFDNGSLYSQSDQLQALQQNNVQFIAPVPGVLSGQFPKLGALGLPYLFKSPEMVDAAIKDPDIGGNIFADLEQKNVLTKSSWLNGWRMVQTRNTPVETLEDMKGVKIRVPPGDNYVQTFKLLDAAVVTIDWGEVPTSLQQGVIDAAEPTPNANLSDKLYEVAPHITGTDHILDFYTIATNKEWFEGLAPDVKKAIEEALDKTAKWNVEQTTKVNSDALQEMQDDGATFTKLSDEELTRWQEVTHPVIEHYKSIAGADVIEAMQDLAGKYDWERPQA